MDQDLEGHRWLHVSNRDRWLYKNPPDVMALGKVVLQGPGCWEAWVTDANFNFQHLSNHKTIQEAKQAVVIGVVEHELQKDGSQ